MSGDWTARPAMYRAPPTRTVPPFAGRTVAVPAAMLCLLLTLVSGSYGYHRDELYFRMLPPAWGYIDQPPLTPWLVRSFGLIADEVWAVRIPATLSTLVALVVVVLITREFGGAAYAQGLCAWGFGFGVVPLLFGHVMLTASVDLVFWPAVVLCVVRAVLRDTPAWWLAAGIVAGLATYNKLLIAGLLMSLLAGLLVAGPRRLLATPWPWLGGALTLAVAAPNLVYQATHDWPQLSMGAALNENNAADTRVDMWWFLFVTLGPPLALVWCLGWWHLLRRAEWRQVRFIAAAFVVLLALAFLAGGQIYYPAGLVVVLFAVGCVPAAAIMRYRGRRRTVWAVVAVNAVVSMAITLPVIPVGVLGRTPVPEINQLARDQVGWPAYVDQISDVVASLPDPSDATLIASNYGEAGALHRYGPARGLPPAHSGHNELYYLSTPPEDARTVIVIGGQAGLASTLFVSCEEVVRLDNGLDVDNEEQGQPVLVCERTRPWSELWPRFRHLD
ncbi:glycosyltransferase family 39 protein [Arthrobacter sp. SX1312]|uniref:glycosyltransferase family 39 protein n=1 Tax=Arthrobacter sp. SX1312 TaxID=2058896 RepID=UPI000CE55A0F|nr:glycosyltransferase family 39 protein [Arthrobacter sp. SX1312]